MKPKQPLLAYFGHHKCATTWLNSIHRLICHELDLNFANVNNPSMFPNGLKRFVDDNRIDFLSFTNADDTYVGELDGFLGYHVIRDPRDIVVSAYYSHLYSHPTEGWEKLETLRQKLQSVSKDEGLLLEMQSRRKQFEDMYNWDYGRDNILELKMENLIASPYEMLVHVFRRMNLVDEQTAIRYRLLYLWARAVNRLHAKSKGIFPFRSSRNRILVDVLLGYIYMNRFAKKARGRKPGEEDVTSHYRKGVSGDWINHFTEEHKQHFKDRYGDLLIKLKYEKTKDW